MAAIRNFRLNIKSRSNVDIVIETDNPANAANGGSVEQVIQEIDGASESESEVNQIKPYVLLTHVG